MNDINDMSVVIDESNDTVILKNVMVSFPHIWTFDYYQGVEERRYKCSFLIPMCDDLKTLHKYMLTKARAIDSNIQSLSSIKYNRLKPITNESLLSKLTDFAGENKYYVFATSNSSDRPASYIDESGQNKGNNAAALVADGINNIFAAGTIVNAKLSISITSDPKSRNVVCWSNLLGIQFVSDGLPLKSGQLTNDDLVSGFDSNGGKPTNTASTNPSTDDDTFSLEDVDFDL